MIAKIRKKIHFLEKSFFLRTFAAKNCYKQKQKQG